MKAWLVTGSSGFIGAHLVNSLSKDKRNVIFGYDLNPPIENFDNLVCISDQEELIEIIENSKIDYVVHLAAQTDVTESIRNPKKDAESNIILTVSLLQSLQNKAIENFIYINSGGATYSKNEPLPFTESSKISPESFYGLSKNTGEEYLKIFGKIYNIPWISLALSNVYGEDIVDGKGVISILFRNFIKNQNSVIYDINSTRDFIYIEDVITAITLCKDKPLREKINICSGNERKLIDVYASIESITSKVSKLMVLEPRKGEVVRSCMANQRALQKIHWSPQVNFENGLESIYKKYLLQNP
jgi:UDP-glucose 4-epimerase